MEPTINYLIATYAGVSKKREKGDKGITPFVLQMHLVRLIALLPTVSLIKQITIIRPNVVDGESYEEYYKIEKYINEIEGKFNVPVRFVDMKNYSKGVSYSQYRYAFSQYPNFDLYMLMEDDWVPMQTNFDKLLISEWKSKFSSIDEKAFLCLWYACIGKLKEHSAISVGMVSRTALSELQERCHLSQELDQYHFSLALEIIGTKIKDFSQSGNKWRIVFWESSEGVLYDFAPSGTAKECLLAPLHLCVLNEQNFQIIPRHIF
jgi:hypothetical protein